MSQSQRPSDAAFTAIEGLLFTKYAEMINANMWNFAATALLVYEYSLSTAKEIHYIWYRKFSTATLIYISNRYLMLLYRFIMTLEMLLTPSIPHGQEICISMLRTTQVISIAMQITLTIFASLRIYAIWHNNRSMCVAAFLFGLVPSAMTIFYYTTVASIVPPPPFIGCADLIKNLNGSVKLGIIDRLCAIAWNIFVFTLVCIKTVGHSKQLLHATQAENVASLLLRDGTIFFGSALCLNALNLLSDQLQYPGTLLVITEVLSSILVSRSLIRLRSASDALDDEDVSAYHSDASFIIISRFDDREAYCIPKDLKTSEE